MGTPWAMGWIELVIAIGVFLASHRIPAAAGVKRALIGRLGPRGYGLVFSAVSLLLLWWVIMAAGRAPYVPLWDQQVWHRWVVNVVMPVAVTLAAFGVGAANPFAFEGRPDGFDPARPGIAGLTRQPLLWALALWSGAHLLANGDVAHALVFAPFFAFSLAGMPMVEGKRKAAFGAKEWQSLTAKTALVPFAALLAGRWRPRALPSPSRLALAALAWVALWHLHAPVVGVWPGP